MFARPGLCGMGIGRLGLVAASRPGLVAQALAILAQYGSAANLYLPGVGTISGITAGNWLDTVGGTPATVDGAVGTVVNALGGVNLVQSTSGNRPILRLAGWQFDGINDNFTSTLTPGSSGFMAASVNRASTNVRHVFFGGGQISSAAGAGARFLTDGALQAAIANGTTRQQVATTATLAPGTVGVSSFWWGGSRLGAAINNTETDTALTINPTSTTQIFLAGATAVSYFDGTIGATIIMPTVLPTATERATLRQFIASISGVTL